MTLAIVTHSQTRNPSFFKKTTHFFPAAPHNLSLLLLLSLPSLYHLNLILISTITKKGFRSEVITYLKA